MPKRKEVDVTVVKSKLELLFKVNDTRLLSDVCTKWAADKKYLDVKYKIKKSTTYPCYSAEDYAHRDGEIDRYTFDLFTEFSHICENEFRICLRKNNGHYLIVWHKNQRIYEFDYRGQVCIDEKKLIDCYKIYQDLFDAIFASIEIYAERPLPIDTTISIDLSSKEIETLIKYASKQHPGADDNLYTRFPTIHVVESGTKVIVAEGYDCDGEVFYYVDDPKTTYDTYEEILINVSIKLLDHYESKLSIPSSKLSDLYTEYLADESAFTTKYQEDLPDYNRVIRAFENMASLLEAHDVDCFNMFCEMSDLQSFKICETYYQDIYRPVAFFLIREEAERYLKYQAHNLGKDSRVFTYSIGFNNCGDLPVMCDMLLRLGNQLKGDK